MNEGYILLPAPWSAGETRNAACFLSEAKPLGCAKLACAFMNCPIVCNNLHQSKL